MARIAPPFVVRVVPAGDAYVDRGDPAVYDFDITDFPATGVWTDLDLSSIVPEGLNAVNLMVRVTLNGAGVVPAVKFRRKGDLQDAPNNLSLYMGAGLVGVAYVAEGLIGISTARKVQYYRPVLPGGSTMDVVVKGWTV